MWAFLGHVLGLDNPSGPWYLWWSGVFADLGEIAAAGALVGIVRKHNCHVHRCWRIGRHQIEGTPWIVCRHHHPHGGPTAEDLKKR